jgi:hypothetical protein
LISRQAASPTVPETSIFSLRTGMQIHHRGHRGTQGNSLLINDF